MASNTGNFGITSALGGLYGSVNKSESSKNEMGMLANLMQLKKQDEAEDEIAQLKAQQYEEEVSKFSDTLLAPDRDKINQKAKLLGHNIRQQVQVYGGDMKKFLANGGHKALADYKSNLIRSEESSTYLDNKKNMDMIVKAQMDGMGHLINSNDLYNAEQYNKNKGGNITWTGLLNEIEMPDAKAYDYGTKVPANDILMNKSNRVKIYGNFKMTYPNFGEPSDQDLENFVEKNYQVQGENWQRQAQIEAQKTARLKEMAKMQKESMSGTGKNTGVGPFNSEYSNKYTGQVAKTMSYIPNNLTVDQFQEGYWDTFAQKNQINNTASGDYKDFAVDYNLTEDSFFDFHTDDDTGLTKNLIDAYHDKYAPRNAKRFFNGHEARVAKSILNLNEDEINLGMRTINNMIPDKTWYDSMGTKLGDRSSEIDYKKYEGEWKVDGIINIATVNGNNKGRPVNSMVVNVVDGDGKIKEEDTKKMFNEYGQSTLQQKMAIVMKNKDGVTFYAPIEMEQINSTKLSKDLGDYDDMKATTQDQEVRAREDIQATRITAEAEQKYDSYWSQIDGNVDYFKPIYTESAMYSKNGQWDGMRDDMIKAFYGATVEHDHAMEGTNAKPEDFKYVSQSHLFTKWLTDAEGEQGEKYGNDMKNYRMSDTDIIQKMITKDPNNKELYLRWLQNYKYLQSKQ